MKRSEATNEDELNRICEERTLLARINSNQIVKVHDIHVNKSIYVFLEDMDAGTLAEVLQNFPCNGLNSEESLRSVIFQIASGLRDLHKHDVLHRDLTTENIWCSKEGDVKLVDLGTAKFIDRFEKDEYRRCK